MVEGRFWLLGLPADDAPCYPRDDSRSPRIPIDSVQLFHEYSWNAPQMSIVERIHGGYVHTRRVRVLCDHLSSLIPRQASVLDVGTGDGLLAKLLSERRPDLLLQGLDVLPRAESHIPVQVFDGEHIPYPDKSFDVVLFVDVLHHANDAMALLREAIRT